MTFRFILGGLRSYVSKYNEVKNNYTQGIVMPQDLNKDKRQISHIQRQKYKCKYEEKYM